MACVRKNRGRWVCDFRDLKGRRHIEVFSTKREAQDRLAFVQPRVSMNSYDPTRAKEPLRCYAASWLASKKVSMAPNTHRSYEGAWRVHIDPVLGDVPIGRVGREPIRAFLTMKLAQTVPKEMSKDTVRIIHATLRAMLEEAVSDGIIPTNCARGVMKGLAKDKIERRMRVRYFTKNELQELLAAAAAVAPDWFSYLLLLARAGLRPEQAGASLSLIHI